MFKKIYLLALVASFVTTFSSFAQTDNANENVTSISCYDSSTKFEVNLSIDEEGEFSKFEAKLYGKSLADMSMYHIETEADGMKTEGAVVEFYAISSDESSAASLALTSRIESESKNEDELLVKGIFNFASETEEFQNVELVCSMK